MNIINKITDKLEELIKERIKELGLVKTGKLLNSIKVTHSGDSFKVEAEDYYTNLDEKYNISQYVIESNEFKNYVEEIITKELENGNNSN